MLRGGPLDGWLYRCKPDTTAIVSWSPRGVYRRRHHLVRDAIGYPIDFVYLDRAGR